MHRIREQEFALSIALGQHGSPEEKPAGGGWSPKVSAIWKWKTEIPQTFPDEVFYGKVPGGDAVLMEMEYFRTVHYPKHRQSVSELDPLSQAIYEFIREPRTPAI